MEEGDKGCPMIRMGVSVWMFLLVPACPGSPGPKAVKRFCVFVCAKSQIKLTGLCGIIAVDIGDCFFSGHSACIP